MSIIPPGPYSISGVEMETWLIRFDENGLCVSPKTKDALIKKLAGDKNRPVIFFSHGWNNDFANAVDLYRRFLQNFETICKQYGLPGPTPIFVGVTWPSIWLPSDSGPQMAAGGADPFPLEAVRRELVRALPAATDLKRLYELLDSGGLSADEAKELGRLIAPALGAKDDAGTPLGAASDANIMRALEDLQRAVDGQGKEEDLDKIGLAGDEAEKLKMAGGTFEFLDPRTALRLASLYIMKDRAGKVGTAGVADLLRAMLDATQGPINAVGHSFGGKVMLSAVAARDVSRKLRSLLLLQPAVSHLSFAEQVPGRDRPGGYRVTLDRVEKPIFSTYSAADFPLHTVYHRFLLRDIDVGEAPQAAAGATRAGEPPNVYAALGGYGPRGAKVHLLDPIPKPGEVFAYNKDARLVGLDGTLDDRIDSHGGVATPYTAWALRALMT